MTPAEVLARHEESQGPWPEAGHVCLVCWQPWTCDAVLMARRLVLTQAALDEMRTHFETSAFAAEKARSDTERVGQRMGEAIGGLPRVGPTSPGWEVNLLVDVTDVLRIVDPEYWTRAALAEPRP